MSVDIAKLRELYLNPAWSVKQIAEELGISVHTVRAYATRQRWSRKGFPSHRKFKEDLSSYIKANYSTEDWDTLLAVTGQNKHALQEWARKRGLTREVSGHRRGDISVLLSGDLESFYWLGLLAADGYISKEGHLMFSQGEKDKEMVYKFADYTGSNVYEYNGTGSYTNKPQPTFRVNILDAEIGQKIREMWGVKTGQTKTYASISGTFIKTKQQAEAFLIGFFDGDGHLTTTNAGSIEVHSAWLDFLAGLAVRAELTTRPSINKRGYARLSLSGSKMRYLKQFAIDNALPCNSRKWPS